MTKLVRDKIPEIIHENDGVVPTYYELESRADFREMLGDKLLEELAEYSNASNRDERIEELADITEVIICYAHVDDYTAGRLEKRKNNRLTLQPELLTSSEATARFTRILEGLNNTPSQSERLERLADLLHCVDALAEKERIRLEEIHELRLRKRLERGGFMRGVVLVEPATTP